MFRGHISQGSLNKQHQQEIYRDREEMMDCSCHIIRGTEKTYHLLSVSWRARKASGSVPAPA